MERHVYCSASLYFTVRKIESISPRVRKVGSGSAFLGNTFWKVDVSISAAPSLLRRFSNNPTYIANFPRAILFRHPRSEGFGLKFS